VPLSGVWDFVVGGEMFSRKFGLSKIFYISTNFSIIQ